MPVYFKISPILKTISINNNALWYVSLKARFWDKAALQFCKICILPGSPVPKDDTAFAFHAADHGMAVSAPFYARYSAKKLQYHSKRHPNSHKNRRAG
jgi:hypothetical protein